MVETNFLLILLVGIFVGGAAGFLGSFMVLKRMALVGDAFTHVALPGMAIALLLNFDPMIGAFLALALAALGIWYFEETSRIYPEALVGIFFTTALAAGVLITPEPELLEALFGNIESITAIEGIAAIILSVVVSALAYLISKKLILGVVSEELATSVGISKRKINLLYLFLVAITVTLGIRFVGTLLMGALVIIPAASAKNISSSLNNYYLLSVFFGVASAIVGIGLTVIWGIASGPAVVLTSTFFFLTTFIVKTLVQKE